jgi:hypothetical protein
MCVEYLIYVTNEPVSKTESKFGRGQELGIIHLNPTKFMSDVKEESIVIKYVLFYLSVNFKRSPLIIVGAT